MRGFRAPLENTAQKTLVVHLIVQAADIHRSWNKYNSSLCRGRCWTYRTYDACFDLRIVCCNGERRKQIALSGVAASASATHEIFPPLWGWHLFSVCALHMKKTRRLRVGMFRLCVPWSFELYQLLQACFCNSICIHYSGFLLAFWVTTTSSIKVQSPLIFARSAWVKQTLWESICEKSKKRKYASDSNTCGFRSPLAGEMSAVFGHSRLCVFCSWSFDHEVRDCSHYQMFGSRSMCH